ncbi:histidine decarboxylase [Mesorhizobium tianshanense]|uniref:Histidine decarboxylase n=1 Tax=Mesorhizobium tianshanense TaxID=39844 RepID=A0A562NFE1_9HYPH|nr:histidine decarboxylase [Mesorhizobium tianshanense]TWI30915.1 histidine decarboxylase [Mesorhizobium tianshanense]GLS37875.1 histidine decarboxylase [Mesorhizobium tianshanense]
MKITCDILDTRLSTPAVINATLDKLSNKFADRRAKHLGYPYNLDFDAWPISQFGKFFINNLGDPYVGSHYATEVCGVEREVVDWFARVWECADPEEYWGAVGASGTEGNLWALYLARETLGNPVLIHSTEAHYSVPKAAKILRVEALTCEADHTGAICPDALREVVQANRHRCVILALTCGTTMKGAHDDIASCISVLDQVGIDPSRRFVHVDGALNAMVLPFVDGLPSGIRPSFRHGIDSMSTSGHKMIGTPMPCGVLVVRREHVRRVASTVSYLRSDDTTLMGSRNGHAVLAIWNRLTRLGIAGFRHFARTCIERADGFAGALRSASVPVLLNPCSLTVVFPKPSERLVNEYQLACHGNCAHAIVMPNVKADLIDRFVGDYTAEWPCNSRQKVFS